MRAELIPTFVAVAATLGAGLMLSRPLWDRSAIQVAAAQARRSAATATASPASTAGPASTRTRGRSLAVPFAQATPTALADAARPAAYVAGASAVVHLAFAVPHEVPSGATVDLATAATSPVPAAAAIDVTYDPRVLRPRSLEEIDYTDSTLVRGGYVATQEADGVLHLEPLANVLASPRAAGRRAGVAQFEAIAPGTTSLSVTVSPLDSATAVRYDGPSCDCRITVD